MYEWGALLTFFQYMKRSSLILVPSPLISTCDFIFSLYVKVCSIMVAVSNSISPKNPLQNLVSKEKYLQVKKC